MNDKFKQFLIKEGFVKQERRQITETPVVHNEKFTKFLIREGFVNELFGFGGPPKWASTITPEKVANSDQKWVAQELQNALKHKGKPEWDKYADILQQGQEYYEEHGYMGLKDKDREDRAAEDKEQADWKGKQEYEKSQAQRDNSSVFRDDDRYASDNNHYGSGMKDTRTDSERFPDSVVNGGEGNMSSAF